MESQHKQSLTTRLATELLETRKTLQQIVDATTKRFLFFRKKIYYEYGDKTGKFLARALRGPRHHNRILRIQNKKGTLDLSDELIAQHFHDYYSNLYNLPAPHKPAEMQGNRSQIIQNYLTSSKLPKLSEADIEALEQPIDNSKIQLAIKDLKTGKSPGPDGFTSIYYKTFMAILTNPLTKALNSFSTPRDVPPTFLLAHLTVIPKPNKDPTQCPNYRPISLLNLDVKLLTKILANRLKPLLHTLIGLEQAGFMPGREAKDNITKSLNLIYAARLRKIECHLLSSDAEKAFDRVAWDFMLVTCRYVGLGKHMMAWISALYKNPSAKLRINGSLSNTVTITNGTRQGCPLSPLLFILSLEPFIRRVMATQDIQGFKITSTEFKIAAYAADLLFFLTNPLTSIPTLLKEISIYGYISYLKINYAKSEAMNVTLPEKICKAAQLHSSFKWEISALKYLGVWLTPPLSQIFEKNFPPLLKTIGKELLSWHTKNFSWFGRAAICKMSTLTRILYLFRTLPIKIPQCFFQKLQSIQLGFVWAHKRPWIKFNLITRPKDKGGMGLPDYRKYYHASHITRIIDWHCHQNLKDWVFLENELSPIPLKFSSWIPWISYPPTLKQHPLLNANLSIFHLLTKKSDLFSPLSPLTPLRNNSDFPQGMQNHSLQASDAESPLLAKHCFKNDLILDYNILKKR